MLFMGMTLTGLIACTTQEVADDDDDATSGADASTGAARTVFTDRGEAWVEKCDDVKWFDGGQRFTFHDH